MSAPAPAVDGTRTTPGIMGLSHLGLTVRDIPAARDFWCEVMGFEVMMDADAFCMVIERSARLAIGIADHRPERVDDFSERQVGLDHLAIAVPDLPALQAWAARLAERGVPHSPITATDAGHHLNLRAPDDVPVELFVMDAAFAAQFGIGTPADAMARTH